jgi:hypothetical protein
MILKECLNGIPQTLAAVEIALEVFPTIYLLKISECKLVSAF